MIGLIGLHHKTHSKDYGFNIPADLGCMREWSFLLSQAVIRVALTQ